MTAPRSFFDSIAFQNPSHFDIDELAIDPFDELYSVSGITLWMQAYDRYESLLEKEGYSSLILLESRLKERYKKLKSSADRDIRWERPHKMTTDEEYIDIISKVNRLNLKIEREKIINPDLTQDDIYYSDEMREIYNITDSFELEYPFRIRDRHIKLKRIAGINLSAISFFIQRYDIFLESKPLSEKEADQITNLLFQDRKGPYKIGYIPLALFIISEEPDGIKNKGSIQSISDFKDRLGAIIKKVGLENTYTFRCRGRYFDVKIGGSSRAMINTMFNYTQYSEWRRQNGAHDFSEFCRRVEKSFLEMSENNRFEGKL